MILMRFFFWCLITLGEPKNLISHPLLQEYGYHPPNSLEVCLQSGKIWRVKMDKTEFNDDENAEAMKKQTTSIQTNILIVQKRI